LRCLILTPTRELATQTQNVCEQFADNHEITSMSFTGGTDVKKQRKQTHKRVDVLIQTPGRLLDMCNTSPTLRTKLRHVRYVVIDEVDHLLSMGARPQLMKILAEIPQRQTILLSATVNAELKELAHVSLKKDFFFVNTLNDEDSPVPKIEQMAIECEDDLMFSLLHSILSTTMDEIQQPRVLVFFQTSRMCQLAQAVFQKFDFPSVELHAKRTPNQRKRALGQFKQDKFPIMFTSDLSARGLDVSDVNLVVHAGIPRSSVNYTHRIGRTGRMGKEGRSILIHSPRDKEFLEVLESTHHITHLQMPEFPNDKEDPVGETLTTVRDDSELQYKMNLAYGSLLGFYRHHEELNWVKDVNEIGRAVNLWMMKMGQPEIPIIPEKIARTLGILDMSRYIRIKKERRTWLRPHGKRSRKQK